MGKKVEVGGVQYGLCSPEAPSGGGGRLGTEDEEVRLPAAEKTQDFFSP